MNLKERYNLFFNKNKCIKVIITDTNKRVKSYIIRIDDDKSFNVGERTFMIDLKTVFYTNGLPTYFYYIDQPNSISKEVLKKSLKPIDVHNASFLIDVSSSDLYVAMEETITKKIIRYAEDGDKKIINTIFMMGIINVLATLGASYFIYMAIEKVLVFFAENELLIQSIRDFLINSAGQ